MKKHYDPQAIETHWLNQWSSPRNTDQNTHCGTYSIALPPPNVTGTLHMGHGFQQTLMDALIRKANMDGADTLWQAGTDHAGIATQMVVERQLAAEGLCRHDLGRERFIERATEWQQQSGSTITHQISRMGATIDWSRARFSMDKICSRATYAAFKTLHEQGLIYRGKRLVNWDCQLGTAIADLEVENRDVDGSLWHIHYPLTNGQGQLTIATTRPETLLGDTAVAVHPDDERYQSLIGQTIRLPLTQRVIPIIADESVDPSFGTGCVKITPAHDFNDYEVGLRHDLPQINILTLDGHLNHSVPEPYRGLDRFAARQQIIKDLEAANLLHATEPHHHAIPHGDRSGTIIEPMLTDQWFVSMRGLAEPAMTAVRSGRIRFTPNSWEKTYLQWLDNIQDWCISRQLWWGHRIPVWYDNKGNHYVGDSEQAVRDTHGLATDLALTQDPDVLDTWFTAALWPFSSLGWPDQTADLAKYYPTSVMVTGFDIIFFWVARMVMMGMHLTGDVPFHHVYITGLIRDANGQKMSKSKGNVLDPLDLIHGISLDALIEKRTASLMQPKMAAKIAAQTRTTFPDGIAAHGTDALRFTFCALATNGRDIHFDMGRIEGYRNFCNKLWNAARFVLMHTESFDPNLPATEHSPSDRWVISTLQDTIGTTRRHFDQYRFDLLAHTLYEFTWQTYCDWYLEFSKVVLQSEQSTAAQKHSTQHTLLTVLETILRLLHPIIPFITEEIWQSINQRLGGQGGRLLDQDYPTAQTTHIDDALENDIGWLKQVIQQIRTVRGEMNIAPGKRIQLILDKGTVNDQARIDIHHDTLKTLARIEQITWREDDAPLPAAAKLVVDALDLYIPLAGLIDHDAEIKRLEKAIQKYTLEHQKAHQKLSNPRFTANAPEAVVDQEKQRLKNFEETLTKLHAHRARLTEVTS